MIVQASLTGGQARQTNSQLLPEELVSESQVPDEVSLQELLLACHNKARLQADMQACCELLEHPDGAKTSQLQRQSVAGYKQAGCPNAVRSAGSSRQGCSC